MRIGSRFFAACVVALLGVSAVPCTAGTQAVYTGPADYAGGIWSAPDYWDIGLVPVNRGGATYDVELGVNGYVPRFDIVGDNEIDALTFRYGSLTIEPDCRLTALGTVRMASESYATLYVNGGRFTAANVENFVNFTAQASQGGRITLGGVSSAQGSSFIAYDAGSVISATSVQSLTGAGGATAWAGGVVDLSGVTSWAPTYQWGWYNGSVSASGAGSLVKLDALDLSTASRLNISVADGGEVRWAAPTQLQDIYVSITNDGILDLLQLSSLSGTSTYSYGGSSLTLTGAASSRTLNLTHISDTSLYANGGATLTLAGVNAYVVGNYSSFQTLRADGAGSVLDLSALTSVTNNHSLEIQASSGGKVLLPNAAFNSNNYSIVFTSAGENSLVDISAVTETGVVAMILRAENGGRILWGNPTTLKGVNLRIVNGLADGSDLSLGQVTTLDGTDLGFDGTTSSRTLNVSSLRGYNSLSASNGAILSLPSVTAIDRTDGVLSVSAWNGGEIDLSNLTTVFPAYTNGYLQAVADGEGSRIRLNSATADGNAEWSLEARPGGTIDWTCPTDLRRARIGIVDNGQLDLSAVTTMRNVALTLSGTAASRTLGVVETEAVNLSVQNGAALSLPTLTSISTAYGYIVNWTGQGILAEGADSRIDLPNATGVQMNNGYGITFEARSGGKIDASKIAAISGQGSLTVNSWGAGSLVDLSSYDFSGDFNKTISVGDGGEVRWAKPTSVSSLNLYVNYGGILDTSSLVTMTSSDVRVYGSYDFGTLKNLANSRFVAQYGGTAITLPALTNAAGSSFRAEYGATLNVPNLTETAVTSGATSWQADGASTFLSAPALKTVALAQWCGMGVDAYNGGRVDLSALTAITEPDGNGSVRIYVTGENSVLDLSSLVLLPASHTLGIGDRGTLKMGALDEPFTLAFSVYNDGDQLLQVFYGDTLLAALDTVGAYSYLVDSIAAGASLRFFTESGQYYMGEYSITAVPEPALLAHLVVAAALLKRRRAR